MSTTRDNLFHDIFTTALEGGINYWCQCSAYHWSNEDLRGFYADVEDVEDEDEDGNCRQYFIDRSVIAKGYRLATTDYAERISWSSGDNPPLVITDETDWDFDALDADVIVQLGLFGDVVYG